MQREEISSSLGNCPNAESFQLFYSKDFAKWIHAVHCLHSAQDQVSETVLARWTVHGQSVSAVQFKPLCASKHENVLLDVPAFLGRLIVFGFWPCI